MQRYRIIKEHRTFEKLQIVQQGWKNTRADDKDGKMSLYLVLFHQIKFYTLNKPILNIHFFHLTL